MHLNGVLVYVMLGLWAVLLAFHLAMNVRYAHINVYIHMTYMYMYICTHARMLVAKDNTGTCICAYMHLCIKYIYIYIYVSLSLSLYIYIRIYIYMYIFSCVFLRFPPFCRPLVWEMWAVAVIGARTPHADIYIEREI